MISRQVNKNFQQTNPASPRRKKRRLPSQVKPPKKLKLQKKREKKKAKFVIKQEERNMNSKYLEMVKEEELNREVRIWGNQSLVIAEDLEIAEEGADVKMLDFGSLIKRKWVNMSSTCVPTPLSTPYASTSCASLPTPEYTPPQPNPPDKLTGLTALPTKLLAIKQNSNSNASKSKTLCTPKRKPAAFYIIQFHHE